MQLQKMQKSAKKIEKNATYKGKTFFGAFGVVYILSFQGRKWRATSLTGPQSTSSSSYQNWKVWSTSPTIRTQHWEKE